MCLVLLSDLCVPFFLCVFILTLSTQRYRRGHGDLLNNLFGFPQRTLCAFFLCVLFFNAEITEVSQGRRDLKWIFVNKISSLLNYSVEKTLSYLSLFAYFIPSFLK